MKRKDHKIISIGGSIIIPGAGFDIGFLKQWRKFILNLAKKGERFILVIGGGDTCRRYQRAAKEVAQLNNQDLDWLGIHATVFNAQFVKQLFPGYAHEQIITNPTKKVKTNKPIIVAAGWQPGCSTDYDAVLLARTYGVTELINLSNIEYVYDRDPRQSKNAQPIYEIDWATFRREIVGSEWVAGKHAPFDPVASKLAQKLGLRVSILKGANLSEVKKALMGERFRGTVIHP